MAARVHGAAGKIRQIAGCSQKSPLACERLVDHTRRRGMPGANQSTNPRRPEFRTSQGPARGRCSTGISGDRWQCISEGHDWHYRAAASCCPGSGTRFPRCGPNERSPGPQPRGVSPFRLPGQINSRFADLRISGRASTARHRGVNHASCRYGTRTRNKQILILLLYPVELTVLHHFSVCYGTRSDQDSICRWPGRQHDATPDKRSGE